jgi:hypothetical protein
VFSAPMLSTPVLTAALAAVSTAPAATTPVPAARATRTVAAARAPRAPAPTLLMRHLVEAVPAAPLRMPRRRCRAAVTASGPTGVADGLVRPAVRCSHRLRGRLLSGSRLRRGRCPLGYARDELVTLLERRLVASLRDHSSRSACVCIGERRRRWVEREGRDAIGDGRSAVDAAGSGLFLTQRLRLGPRVPHGGGFRQYQLTETAV